MMNPVAKNEQANKLGLSTIAIRVQILSAVFSNAFQTETVSVLYFYNPAAFFSIVED